MKMRIFSILFGLLYLLPLLSFEDGETPTSGIPEEPAVETPFDGGIGILMAAGLAYGVRKAYKIKERKKAVA